MLLTDHTDANAIRYTLQRMKELLILIVQAHAAVYLRI